MMEEVVIKISNIDDIFNCFDDKDISDELASYIENRCSRVQKNLKIKIITDNKLSNDNKSKIINAIRTHYGLETKYNMLNNKRTNQVNILLFIIGVLIILIENIFKIFNSLVNIVDILGGFIMWESAYNLLFTDNEMDRKIDRAKKISDSKIVFECIK